MNLKKLFNPLAYFSEKTLLITGVVCLTVAVFISYYFKLECPGTFKIIEAPSATLLICITMLIVDLSATTLALYAVAVLINKRTRFIDILNTSLIGRIPCYFCLLISSIPITQNAIQKISENKNELQV